MTPVPVVLYALASGHNSVRTSRRYLHLRLVVRVGELAVQDQPEVGVVLDLLVAQPDGAPLLDGVAAEQRVEHRVDLLLDVLDQNHVAVRDRVLDLVEVAALAELHHLQAVAVLRLDPLDALQLRVDHQRPALGVRQDRRVLRRHAVARQALVVPRGDDGAVGEHRDGVAVGRRRDGRRELRGERHPEIVHQLRAVLLREAAGVRDEGRDEQHVAR